MSLNMVNVGEERTFEIDEGLYSRQLYVMGKEAMQQISGSRVLISGVRGLGVEIAKNIILAGVKAVTVQDRNLVDYTDLSSQYYFNESDIGKNRAEIAHVKLAELNSYVNVTFSSKSIRDYLSNDNKFNVIILTDSLLDEQIEVGNFCRTHQIKLILASTKGLFGQIFCDFGDNFEVKDINGETPHVEIVTEISQDADGVVYMPINKRHNFEDNTYVTFSGVKGMTEVNGREFKISVGSSFTITIGDTRNFGKYTGGGTVIEIKKPKIFNFKSYADSLCEPKMIGSDDGKTFMSANLHLAFQALQYFTKKYHTLPKPWDNNDAEKFFDIVNELNFKILDKPLTKELNKNVIKIFSKICIGDLCPIQAVIGGIASQEIMKAITGKFKPIQQYFYFDAIECLPKCAYDPSESDDNAVTESKIELKLPTEISRYYSQEVVFGEDFQHRLGKAKYFIVGSGAIGCEMVKNFAMMGIGCEKDGVVYLTDMDSIERSNLNRQFLFRSSDIGQMKSKTAAEAVKNMNPNINIRSYFDHIGPDTENIYTDDFFEQLDGIANALDNIKAREYIDGRCLYYQKPLIDSGTMGTKGSVQVVVPFITESYSAPKNSGDIPVAMCTIRHFPNIIEHTIEWARDNFAGLFTNPVQQAVQYIQDSNKFIKRLSEYNSEYDRNEIIENVNRILVDERPNSFFDCIVWARKLFERQFHNSITQLLHNFPIDRRTESGGLFWSGIKRPPHVIKFDVSNKSHLDFIVAASNLLAYIYDIPQNTDASRIANEVINVTVPEFQLNRNAVIYENDDQMKADMEEKKIPAVETSNGNRTKIDEYVARLPKIDDLGRISIRPHEFDKDDDTNFHIHYIVASANLRAENYDIEPADRSKIKRIAGHIVPAIATTTAMVTGLVCLEIYKLFQGHKHIEAFRNAFINLATSFFYFSEPVSPTSKKYLDQEYTPWNRFEVKGDLTLAEMIEYFKKEHKLSLTMISFGMSVLYSTVFLEPEVIEQRMKKKLTELYEMITNTRIQPHVHSLILDVFCQDLEGNAIDDVPYIKFTLR